MWDPLADEGDGLLSESIGVLPSQVTPNHSGAGRKNKVVVNFFLWLKEIQGLPASSIDQSIYVTWRHESKRNFTIIGEEGDRTNDQTGMIVCKADRSAVFDGNMDNACIACDYKMLQDRRTLTFEPRVVSFQLMAPKSGKPGKSISLGKAVIDLSHFSYHKLEKTQIFSFGESGVTLVLSILCSWKSFNGDLVDNYDASFGGKSSSRPAPTLRVPQQEDILAYSPYKPEDEDDVPEYYDDSD